MGDVALEFIGTVHLVESYGVRLKAEGRTLAYSGDAGVWSAAWRASPRARTCFCAEATLTEGTCAEEGHHLRAATAGRSGCGKRSKAPAVDALPYTAGADCPAGGPRIF